MELIVEPEDVVAERVRHYRGMRGWKRPDLVKALADLGVDHLHATSIKRIEEGTARVRINDLVALAAALGVPLPALLVHPKPYVSVRLSDHEAIGRDHYRDFLCGLQPWSLEDEPHLRQAALEHIDGLVPLGTRKDIRTAANALAQRRREELAAEESDIEVRHLTPMELKAWRVKSGNHEPGED